MTAHTHTPGPWHVPDRDSGVTVNAGRDAIVAEVYAVDVGTTQMANARLIAAAPELLAACQAALALLTDGDAEAADADKVEATLHFAIARAVVTP
jgi:hypothetical protein